MKARLNALQLAPEIAQQASRLNQTIEASGLDKKLIELVKIRASQINGCAYCLNMHCRDARKLGETEARIYVLAGWRESTLYTPSERAALAWTESLTHLPEKQAPEDQFEELKKHFSEKDIVVLTGLISMINFWNRTAVGLGYVHPAEEAS
jgi:AhpD family alkylhydroperoxidase